MSQSDDELVTAIGEQLAVTRDVAAQLALAAKPLWTALAQHGLTGTYGGAECIRVLPLTLAFIRDDAAQTRVDLVKQIRAHRQRIDVDVAELIRDERPNESG